MASEPVGEYCRAVLLDSVPGRKTKSWRIESGTDLGFVHWHGAFRCYAFYPSPDTVYERKCLRAIADFCEHKTGQHLAAKAQEVRQ